MATLEIRLEDATATRALGQALGRTLEAGTVLLLEGDLGARKTTLTQGIGEGLGITEPVVSPTFTLVCEYPEGRIPLYHFDLYRLEADATARLAIDQYWDSWEIEPGLVVIEWPQRLPTGSLPPDYLHACLAFTPEGGRSLTLTPHGRASLPDLLQP